MKNSTTYPQIAAARQAKAQRLAVYLKGCAIESLIAVARDWSQHDWDVMTKRAGLTYANGKARSLSQITKDLVIDILKKEVSK